MTNNSTKTAWLLAVLLVICVVSPVLTGYGAFDATLLGNRLEIEENIFRTIGYDIREVSYLIIGIFGCYFFILNRKSIVLIILIALLMSFIIIKDISIYSDIEWMPYGLRPIFVAFSCPVIIEILRNGFLKQFGIITVSVKLMILILIPITIYQLFILPSSWGETFLGPRTLGFWPNPIIYSMALASMALYLFVINERNSNYWLLVCALLALTTGGRSGLLAISLLVVLKQVSKNVDFASLSASEKKLVYMIFPIVIFLISVGFFNILSKSEFSGREDTQGLIYGNSRTEYLVDSVAEMANKGPLIIFLGNRLGDGTNAIYSSGKSDEVSDNFFLMIIRSYGIFGFLLFLMIVAKWYKNPSINKIAIAACSFSFMMAQSFLEMHPIAILTLAAVAISIYEQDKSN